MNERRGTRRFAVSLPVMIWRNGQSSALGTTRDISSNGVYFFLGQPLRPGADIDLAVRLTTEITQGREMFLWASGRTVRLEDSPNSPAGRIVNDIYTSNKRNAPIHNRQFSVQTAQTAPMP